MRQLDVDHGHELRSNRGRLVAKPGYDRVYAQTGVRVLDYERFFAGLV